MTHIAGVRLSFLQVLFLQVRSSFLVRGRAGVACPCVSTMSTMLHDGWRNECVGWHCRAFSTAPHPINSHHLSAQLLEMSFFLSKTLTIKHQGSLMMTQIAQSSTTPCPICCTCPTRTSSTRSPFMHPSITILAPVAGCVPMTQPFIVDPAFNSNNATSMH